MKRLLFCLALLSSPVIAIPASAAEAAATDKKAIAPEADTALKRVDDFYRAAKSAQLEIRTEVATAIPGTPPSKQITKATLAISRPNLLALHLEDSPEGKMSLVCDGKTVWTYIPALKQFTVSDAPQSLELLLRDHDLLAESTSMMGPVTELFRDQAREHILLGVSQLEFNGTEKIEGTDCEKIRGEQEDMDWTAWFEAGPKPVLRKFAFSPLKGMLATAPAETKEKLKNAKIDVTVAYGNWQIDAPIPEKTFAFQPPDGAKKVAEFGPIAEERAPAPSAARAEKPHNLAGKPAPDISLDLLDGGKMQLSEHKGKNVVILDFWATWCGPCVQGLPGLAEIAATYRDKGVVAYAVNQQENPEKVKQFMESRKLALTVAMDAKREAKKLYQVQGIPQTVIIDKEGNVVEVHVGFGPGTKAELIKSLEKVLGAASDKK